MLGLRRAVTSRNWLSIRFQTWMCMPKRRMNRPSIARWAT